jgi:hypothetical protein
MNHPGRDQLAVADEDRHHPPSHLRCDFSDPSEDNSAWDRPSDSAGRRREARIRFLAAMTALVPLFALGLARQLEPSSSGLGTHQQLGLPPCSMRLILGIRCPGCGMTTSWSHFVRGDWHQSLATSVGGFLFALFAVWIAFLALRTLFTARIPGDRTQTVIVVTAIGIFAISILQWLYRLGG